MCLFTSDPQLGEGTCGLYILFPCQQFLLSFAFSALAQLTYVLLDIAIQELFPELNRVKATLSSFP